MMNIQCVVFDLDGTLAESKSQITTEISQLLSQLLSEYFVGIISGASFNQYQKQVIPHIYSCNLNRLYLMPTCGAQMYGFEQNNPYLVYKEELNQEEIEKITKAFDYLTILYRMHLWPSFGQRLEIRGSQITFSVFGQEAPLHLKETFDTDSSKRKEMVRKLQMIIPEFEIRIGGTTSIDVTRKGIDKAFGISKLLEQLKISPEEMIFIGDALFEGGNDAAVKKVLPEDNCWQTSGVEQTKELIRRLLN